MNCLHCGAPTSNGLGLCELCQRKVSTCLEFLPVYFRNVARWRPARAGARPHPGSREPMRLGASMPDRVVHAVDQAAGEVTEWARKLSTARPGRLARTVDRILAFEEERAFRLLCALFEKYLTSIATLDWAGQFVDACDEQEVILRHFTETAAPGWYAGSCRQCKAPTFVVPGLTWVSCTTCGAWTNARDHLDVILDEARGWVAPPNRLAETLVALLDTEQSVPRLHDRIRQWGTRERITVLRSTDDEGDEIGPRRYRLGEVLDVLLTEGPTRTQRAKATAS